MTKKLLVATTNNAKLSEYKNALLKLPLEIVSLKYLGITQKVAETGASYVENARIKAQAYHNISGLPTLVDDGGFEIDALGGEPGIHSHRWIHKGREDTDDEIITYALDKLVNVPQEKRTAKLRLVAVLLINQKEHVAESVVRGIIPAQACQKRVIGFPYRSLLYFPEMEKYSIELTSEEGERYNNRKRVVEQLKFIITKYLTPNT